MKSHLVFSYESCMLNICFLLARSSARFFFLFCDYVERNRIWEAFRSFKLLTLAIPATRKPREYLARNDNDGFNGLFLQLKVNVVADGEFNIWSAQGNSQALALLIDSWAIIILYVCCYQQKPLGILSCLHQIQWFDLA